MAEALVLPDGSIECSQYNSVACLLRYLASSRFCALPVAAVTGRQVATMRHRSAAHSLLLKREFATALQYSRKLIADIFTASIASYQNPCSLCPSMCAVGLHFVNSHMSRDSPVMQLDAAVYTTKRFKDVQMHVLSLGCLPGAPCMPLSSLGHRSGAWGGWPHQTRPI